MNTSLLSIIFTVTGWIFMIIWSAFRGGSHVGKEVAEHKMRIRQLKQDIQSLHEVISTNNNMHDRNYKEFYREFTTLRVKIAKELGINGS